MTNHDVFAVTWQGGGGFGDPLERDPDAVQRDVASGLVSHEAATEIYGTVFQGTTLDGEATVALRQSMLRGRVERKDSRAAASTRGKRIGMLGESLFLVEDDLGIHVATPAGYVLCTGSTRWRSGAVAKVYRTSLPSHKITLHASLALTAHHCPGTGTLLAVDVHERGSVPEDDVILDLEQFRTKAAEPQPWN
jgi:N-methylhydantoinase B